jgi:O-antigen/teichoic acid export membrane protein
MALDMHKMSARVLISSSLLRVVASLILLGTSSSATVWAYLYVSAAIIAVTMQIIQVARVTSAPRVQLGRAWKSLREGFHFATSMSAQTIYDNIDKGMLARLSSVEAAAIYAVAYRFVDASILPIRALAAATYPEFFRQGEGGVTATYDFARRILRRSMLYGAVASLLLFFSAGLVPALMGHKFAESALALRWLSPLPFIKSIHAFLTDTLTGGDHQASRSAAQLGVAAFNVLINLWLIRAYSWRGASASSIITDLALVVSLFLVIRYYLRREGASSARSFPSIRQSVQPAVESQ